jgi:hypothetical protein
MNMLKKGGSTAKTPREERREVFQPRIEHGINTDNMIEIL